MSNYLNLLKSNEMKNLNSGVDNDDHNLIKLDNLNQIDDDKQQIESNLSMLSILPTNSNNDDNDDDDCCELREFQDKESNSTSLDLNDRPRVCIGASFSCDKVCALELDCGKHRCLDFCHPGPCDPCKLNPRRCLTCACGKVLLHKLVGFDTYR